MLCEAENTAIRTFARSGKSEEYAHKTSPQYVLEPFSSFRFLSAEIRKKNLKTHL